MSSLQHQRKEQTVGLIICALDGSCIDPDIWETIAKDFSPLRFHFPFIEAPSTSKNTWLL